MRLYWKLFAGMFLFVLLTGTNAFAVLDLHGQVFYDTYMYTQDAEGFARPGYSSIPGMITAPGSGGIAGVEVGTTPAAEDRKQTYFDLNHATAIRAHWQNKEKLGAFFAMYMNGDPAQSSSTGSGGFKVGMSVALMYWDVNPNLRLIAGKGGTTQIFSPEDPTRYMGYDGIGHVTGLGYGNINSKYQNNVRMTYKFNENFKFDFGLFNPRLSADNESYAGFGPGFTAKAGTAVDNVSKIPKMEVGVPMTFQGGWGFVNFTPSAMYLKSEFENVASGDDSITSYGLSASTKISIDNFKFRFEYNYGQNLANAARTGESQCTPFKWEYIVGGLWKGMAARVGSDNKVYDGETHAFWMQFGYDIANKVRPTIFYGRNDSEREMPAADGSNVETTTQFYGVNVPIKVTKNLTIVPEYMIWDNGDNNLIDGTRYNFGKESMVGVQMRLVF